MDSSTSRTRDAVWLAAILLLAAVLRLFHLGQQPLWLDEATTAEFAARDFAGAVFAEAPHPPLYRVLMWAWVHVAGGANASFPPGDDAMGPGIVPATPRDDALLRLPSAICGVLAVWMMWRLARRMFPSEALQSASSFLSQTPFIAAAMAALSPYLLFLSQEARSYSVVIFLSLAATTVFWNYCFGRDGDAASAGRQGTLAMYALLSAALLYTHYFTAFLLLAHELVFWLNILRLKGVKRADLHSQIARWLVARVAAGLAFAPWLVWAARALSSDATAWIGSIAIQGPLALLRYLAGYGVAPPNSPRSVDPLPLILREEGWAIAFATLPLLWLAWRGAHAVWNSTSADGETPRYAVRMLFAGALLLPILIILALSPRTNLLHDRNLAWQAPFLVLLVACGVASLGRRARLVAASACGAAMLFSVLCYLGVAYPADSPKRYVPEGRRLLVGYQLQFGKEDWRSAAAHVAQVQPDAIVFAPEYLQIPFLRYAALPSKRAILLYEVRPRRRVPNVAPDARIAPRVALILSREGPAEAVVQAAIERDRRLVSETYFPQHAGLRVLVYDVAARRGERAPIPTERQEGAQR